MGDGLQGKRGLVLFPGPPQSDGDPEPGRVALSPHRPLWRRRECAHDVGAHASHGPRISQINSMNRGVAPPRLCAPSGPGDAGCGASWVPRGWSAVSGAHPPDARSIVPSREPPKGGLPCLPPPPGDLPKHSPVHLEPFTLRPERSAPKCTCSAWPPARVP